MTLELRRAMWTFVAMAVGAASCGHSCGGKEDYDSTPCTNLKEGGPCRSVTSTTCEEKQHANPTCNVTWECEFLSDKWKRIPAKAECPTPCPPVITRTLPGACDVNGATPPLCEYPEGICGCTKSGEWKCVGRTVRGGDLEECPRIRPPGGAKGCPSEDHWPKEDLSCDYGDTELLGAVSAQCRHHSWELTNYLEDSALARHL
jgi:hypothetical protein